MTVPLSPKGFYSYTLSLTGVPGAGKTAIFNHVKRKAGDSVVESESLDGGIDCCVYSTTIDGTQFKISLYDTGGLERFASLTSNYFHRTHAVILVYVYCNSRLDTITRLNPFIDNALSYNKCPSSLVFAVWGHDRKDIPTSDKPTCVPDLAKALMANNDIPLSMHCTVCADDDEDSRLMDALHACILAVHGKNRPKSDSVLTPAVIKLQDSLEDSIMDSSNTTHKLAAAELERIMIPSGEQQNRKKSRKCCHKN